MKPLQEQVALLQRAGVELGASRQHQNIVVYCNGGVASTSVALALYRAGHTAWSNYDGSWNEWGNTGDAPVEE